MPDSIVLLSPLDGRPTVKRISLDSQGKPASEPAPLAKWFRSELQQLDSYQDLVLVLQTLAQAPEWFAVRGALLPSTDPSRMQRTHVNSPTLAEQARYWLLLDLDKYLPKVTDFAERPEHYAQAARAALPACFQQAACWWQATGSAGFKPGVRLRLAFWLDRPLDNAQIKAWAQTWDLPVDLALFTPSQPHFTGAPILDGLSDPVQGPRSGELPGLSDTVQVPDLAQAERLGSFKADDDLRAAARRVKTAAEGERRNTLNRTAFSLGTKYPDDILPAKQIAEALRNAAEAGGLPGQEAEATIQAALADGRAKAARDRAGWRSMLARDEKTDRVKSSAANVSIYLEHHEAFQGKLAYDERALRPLWLEAPPWSEEPGPVTESDDTYAVEWFQVQAGIDAKAAWVRAGLLKSAKLKSFDPIQDYLGKLPAWDGQARVDTLFIRHLGVADTRLNRAQTAAWLISAVRRAFATVENPVQADYLIVLSGPTGLRKSTVLRELCPVPRFFRSDLPDITTKDARQAMADSWIVELAELTHRKADRDAFKAFVTALMDKFRPPYGKDEITVPRKGVLAGTTNETEFLVDPTGNRRFWPLVCTHAALAGAVAAERDQLWSEVVIRAQAGEKAYLSAELELEAAQVQEDHREEDLAETALEQALRSPTTGTPFELVTWTPDQIGPNREVLHVTSEQACALARVDPRAAAQSARVKASMRRLGWIEVRTRNAQGVRKRYWTPPQDWAYNKNQAVDQKRIQN